MLIVNKMNEDKYSERKLLWVEPYHFQLGHSLHSMADIEVSKRLLKRQFSTFLIIPRSKKSVMHKIGSCELRTISIPVKHMPFVSSLIYAVSLSLYLPFFLISRKPDFIISVPDVSIISFIPLVIITKLTRIKIILDIRSVPVETFGFLGFLQNFWFNISLLVAKKLFDGITAITPLMKLDICNRYGIKPEGVGVWTSGVSEQLFKIDNNKIDDLRTKYQLTKKFIIFYHGVFTASRGLKETIESLKILKNAGYDLVFFLLGSGPALSSLTEVIRKNKLEGNVVIHTPVEYEKVPKFIQMSNICIVPLPDNPFWRSQSPLKLLEYLAMEKTIILTNIPAHKFVVGDCKCGIYISSVTPIEIAKAVIHALNNRDKLAEWGKLGRKIIRDGYTWAKVAEDLSTYLLSIEGKK
jgi:glycosyltransferase involved in cell wall biosynthesis